MKRGILALVIIQTIYSQSKTIPADFWKEYSTEEKIAFSVYDGKWMDIGTPERLEKVRRLEQDPK